ncbi:50S ribosomal protein 5, chloroplastic [Impatiens glandulifera]|uniref:50S ribosomal protein 5, chloroplastic n=1 Tax=Impatiens glandulifera TaxID=253017 RepID=UPI001FB16778|nr:50S ribosomal protein 5, chloroplastic [Impatiens glandulifera]
MALCFNSCSPRFLLLPSPPSTSTSSIAAIPFNRSTKDLKLILARPPIHGLMFHNSFLIPKGKRDLIIVKATDGVDGIEQTEPEPAAVSEGGENVQVQDLPLESKQQMLLEQKLKMKLAKKIRMRRKRLVSKRRLRKKGKWPPSKINRNV